MPPRQRFKVKGKSRFVIRDKKGRFKDIENVGKAIRRDLRTKAKTKVKPGYGYRGDLK